jgi:hypothetical protein
MHGVVVLILLVVQVVSGQELPTGKLRVRAFDSETGFPVSVGSMKLNMVFSQPPTSRAGEIEAQVGVGSRALELSVPGYQSLRVTVDLRSKERGIVVYLSPLRIPPQFEAPAMQFLLGSSIAGVNGFLSDDQTGRPLSGVLVTAGEAQVTGMTDAVGYFALSVPVPMKSDRVTTSLTFSKAGYVTLVRSNADLFANDVKKYRLRLRPGVGKDEVNEALFRGRGTGSELVKPYATFQHNNKAAPLSLPANIRVGLGCGGPKDCKTVVVNTLEDYAKHVLDKEWIPSWHMESLKAGSVAVRGYGAWHTEHPLTDTYDICSTTACQVYDPDSTTSRTDAAVDATKGKVMLDAGGQIARSEYSAENNDAGCGDGKTGTGAPVAPCISDITCKGATNDGHGRGMCQRGSQRWALGKDNDGNQVDGGSEQYDWILKHYYTSLTVGQGILSYSITMQ